MMPMKIARYVAVPAMRGWLVRVVCIDEQGSEVTAQRPYGKYGTKREALAAADQLNCERLLSGRKRGMPR